MAAILRSPQWRAEKQVDAARVREYVAEHPGATVSEVAQKVLRQYDKLGRNRAQGILITLLGEGLVRRDKRARPHGWYVVVAREDTQPLRICSVGGC